MIELYSGTPGSGKSLHVAREIAYTLAGRKKAVIANFPVNLDLISNKGKKKIAEFVYLPNHELTTDYLINYARNKHVVGREGQTLIVIDEAGIMFNSRDYGSWDRKAWIQFFMTHRHFGYNVILVSQIDRMIDRQIRGFIEYDIKHRKLNNFKLIGLFLTLLRIPVFAAVTYWYGMREKCNVDFIFYRKRDSKLYDTMMLFGDDHGGAIGAREPEPVSTSADAGGDGAPALAGGSPSRPRPQLRDRIRRLWIILNTPIDIRRLTSKKTKNREQQCNCGICELCA